MKVKSKGMGDTINEANKVDDYFKGLNQSYYIC